MKMWYAIIKELLHNYTLRKLILNKDFIDVVNTNKFTIISINKQEGIEIELTFNLNNDEKFMIHRKYRKKYLKLRNLYGT